MTEVEELKEILACYLAEIKELKAANNRLKNKIAELEKKK